MLHGLHVHIEGSGPAVVLEAGIAATSLSWRLVQPGVAKFARVASYDRAGLGWSEPAEGPRNGGQLVEDLRQALAAARLPAPYVLVGHSFGGLIVRLYAARFPKEVAGVVLVDPVHPREWAEPTADQRRALGRGIALARRGAILAHAGVVRACLGLLSAGVHAFPRWFARVSSGGAGVAERLVTEVRKLPPEVWPIVQAHWSLPRSFHAMAKQLAALPESAREAAAPIPGHIPCIVLAAAGANAVRRSEYEREAGSRLRVVESSGHWIQLDDPQAVVDAIRTILKA